MSIFSLRVGSRKVSADSSQGYDLSIPYRFKDQGLNAFGVDPASVQTVENNNFLGDTRRSGSCNVEQYTLIPHCHGTHTECVGHIVDEFLAVVDILKDVWVPAVIITVELERAGLSKDQAVSSSQEDDFIISRQSLNRSLEMFSDPFFSHALIIRTLPNHESKKTREYDNAPYFSNEAMENIVTRPVQHLLVDIPSVDRMCDQGKLSNHRLFWGLEAGQHTLGQQSASLKTITEFIYIADEIKDGYYLLNLQLSPFEADAAPSRPMVYPELKHEI